MRDEDLIRMEDGKVPWFIYVLWVLAVVWLAGYLIRGLA